MNRSCRTSGALWGLATLLVFLCGATAWAAQEISFWTWASGQSFAVENQLLDIFRKANPHINLLYIDKPIRNGEALVVAVAGGAAPDLVTTHQDWHRDFALSGAFLDLRPFIERDRFDLSIFPKELMKYYTGPNGEITGLPFQFTTILLGYNKARYDDQALAYPKSQWTLDDLVSAARKLTTDKNGDGQIDTWGIDVGYLPDYVWRLWGVDMMSPDGLKCNLGDPRAIAAFDWLTDLLINQKIAYPKIRMPSNHPDWMNGHIATTLAWPHYLTAWGQTLADEWDIQDVPTAPVGYKVARGATAGWAIPATAKNPEIAWQILKFLASDEAQLYLLNTGRGGASTRAVARHWSLMKGTTLNFKNANSMKNVQAMVNAYSYASIDRYPPGFAQIHTEILNPAIRRIIAGTSPARTELPQVAAQIEARVAARK